MPPTRNKGRIEVRGEILVENCEERKPELVDEVVVAYLFVQTW